MIVRKEENTTPSDTQVAQMLEEALDNAITSKTKHPIVRFTVPEHVRNQVLDRYRTEGGYIIEFTGSSRSGSHFNITNL